MVKVVQLLIVVLKTKNLVLMVHAYVRADIKEHLVPILVFQKIHQMKKILVETKTLVVMKILEETKTQEAMKILAVTKILVAMRILVEMETQEETNQKNQNLMKILETKKSTIRYFF